MHFITGGAYNGKANWVKQHVRIEHKRTSEYEWINVYANDTLHERLADYDKPLIIIEGLEQWVWQLIDKYDENTYTDLIHAFYADWVEWSDAPHHFLYLIGTDISKGIVPTDQKQRIWRDVTGWLYQRIVERCDTFHIIWYGIGQRLK